MSTEGHPRVAAESIDSQRSAVYGAQECAAAEMYTDDAWVDSAALDTFATSVLTAVGWQADPGPVFALDVPDDSEFAGWHEGATGVIHLHPQLLSRWTVLHELAHWVDNRDGHGPRFCANFLELVRAGIGHEAERELLDAFESFGVEVDETWLHVDRD